MSENKNLNVECPYCRTENTVIESRDLQCRECEKPLTGFTYRKPLVSSLVALAIGGGAVIAGEALWGKDRYPVLAEYSIVETCTSSDRMSIRRSDFMRKRKVCACALERTAKEVSYEEFQGEPEQFLEEFSQQVAACLDKVAGG